MVFWIIQGQFQAGDDKELQQIFEQAGANNLLDVYLDEADPSFQSSGRFVYSLRAPQFSFGGRHLFARLAFTLK